MNKGKVFQCPSCGAALDYDDGDDLTVRCPYCDASVIVPEELRDKEPAYSMPAPTPIQIKLPKPAPPKGCAKGCVRTALVVGIIGLALLGVAAAVIMTTDNPLAALFNRPDIPSFADVALTFGGEGTGPGLFTDARHIAVDGEGNVYVGEYRDGRVQVFDASGEFVSLWMVDNETPLRGLAANHQGTVYVVQGGEILNYEGATGQFLGHVEYAEGWGFEDIVATADGGLVAAWHKGRDDIVRFDAQGNVILTIPEAISGQSGDSELDTRVAVDGLGNIYALGGFNNAVFKFIPDGKFVARFGGEGDAPGQFHAPRAIAVDGQGRVYVGDFKGIQVFDADGRYLDVIEVDGPVFGMAFNDQNELFVAARHQVIKYALQP
jgi:outer membrane protein assembly factor BamB/DNA-directed RNA polymerase subunit RPC12/RpoP